MKKLLKKGLCLVMAMVMALALGIPALAAEEADSAPAEAAPSDWACKHPKTGEERNEAGYEMFSGEYSPRYNVRIYCTYCGVTLEQRTEYGDSIGRVQGSLSGNKGDVSAQSSDWACKHLKTGEERNEIGYEITSGGCRPRYNVRTYCTYCGITLKQKTEYGRVEGHIQGPLSSATCNGRTQTWQYRCRRGCGYVVLTETVACYGAPHQIGACQWLPM